MASTRYYADPSAADQGSTANASSIKSLIDNSGGKPITIVCEYRGGAETRYTILTSLEDAATITLEIEYGAIIDVGDTVVFTINGHICAPRYKIFDLNTSGSIIVNSIYQNQYQEWVDDWA